MKNRLTKSINRLKKEKKIVSKHENDTKSLSAINVKVFRNLTEKYDLSLTINDSLSNDEKKEKSLSLGAQMTLERLKKSEDFSP